MAHDLAQFGRRAAVGEAADGGLRHVNIDQHAGDLMGGGRHRFLSDRQVQGVIGDEAVERIEIGPVFAVHLDDLAVDDTQRRLRVIGAVGDGQAGFGPLFDVCFAVDVAPGEDGEAARAGFPVDAAVRRGCCGHSSSSSPCPKAMK